MGKTAMMAIAAFLVIGATREIQRQNVHLDTEYRDGQTKSSMLARGAAQFGFERAKQYLVSSGTSTSLTGTYQSNASYTSSISVASGVATVRSNGLVRDGKGQWVDYKVVSEVERRLELPSSAPSFMQFALFIDDDLTLGGNILIDTFHVEGDTRATSNANLHTNGSIRVNGGAALVRGFGTYVQNKHVSQETRVFKPYSNPTSASVLARTAAVTLPDFDPATVAAALVPNTTTTGNLTLSGTKDFTSLGATRDDPYVWHVTGNLTVASDAMLKGYVVFVVNGNMVLNGGDMVSLSGGFAESNAAWYAGGNITLQGNSEVWGQFYTRSNIIITGSPSIYGSVIGRSDAAISGSPKLYYVPASAALTTYWQPAEVRLYRLSYSEGW